MHPSAAGGRHALQPTIKTLTEFDFRFRPSIQREPTDSLHELGFVQRRENIVFLGPPGVGRTPLAIRLAIAAAERGRRVDDAPLVNLMDSSGAPGGGWDRRPSGQPERSGPVAPTREPAL